MAESSGRQKQAPGFVGTAGQFCAHQETARITGLRLADISDGCEKELLWTCPLRLTLDQDLGVRSREERQTIVLPKEAAEVRRNFGAGSIGKSAAKTRLTRTHF